MWMPIAIAVGHGPSTKHGTRTQRGVRHSADHGFCHAGLLFIHPLSALVARRADQRRRIPALVAAFLISPLVAAKYPDIQLSNFLWNVPSSSWDSHGTDAARRSVGGARGFQRPRAQTQPQLQKFASITSRLLTGAEVNSLCREIAEAIGETTNFRRS